MDHAPEKREELDELQGGEDEDRAGRVIGVADSEDEGAPSIPDELPILPVRGVVVFPGTVVPLTIGREKSKRLMDAVLAGNKMLAIFAQRRDDVEDPGINDVYRVGTAATVLKLLRMPDGSNSLLVHGLVRVGLEQMVSTEPYWKAVVHAHEDPGESNIEIEALAYAARRTAEQIMENSPNVPEEARIVLSNIERPGPLADFLSANLSLGLVQKQELLETFDIADRLRKVNATLNNQLEVLQLSQKIQQEVRGQIDKTQREYYLNEQMRAIRKELGEEDSRDADVQELKKRVTSVGMPEVVLKEATRELARLQRVSQASPENGVIRDYLEWLCEMPWTAATTDNLDLKRAETILNQDHYGLERIKRRILEFLAVRKLKPTGKGPILCFAGPPGVGKTSLGQSIARALDRKFIRIALGGVRDEADIRGHRRTYIGAIPGRLVQEIRRAAVRNPVVMLDELDKLASDFRGDPAAALLEVLDPAQNHSFTDHYLGVPFDLSAALFIATANYMDPVPPALRDRMEVIELPGYTSAEKLEIAKRYLAPRQAEENGLKPEAIQFSDKILRELIDFYTREAGVRNLERNIGTACRAVAARVAKGEKVPPKVTSESLEECLGPPRFESEIALAKAEPGVATGLAYTPVGGEIIFVEAAAMAGRGGFTLTGQIGDVMRESAQAALSLLRGRAEQWGIKLPDLGNVDVHIHVPAGGIPKDGPSAGVAMLTALVSLMTRRAVDPTVGMTGEITLRGLVLPIGGVKEKVLGAHRAGLKTVILPSRNRPDLHEVPDDVRKAMNFVFAERVEDVLNVAFAASARGTPKGPKTPKAAGSRRKRPTSPPRKSARPVNTANGRRRAARGA
ncbi:Lon protease 2 [Phycisphaerae bacterium RAS1]|nr:Lon protease 2 [Phycisphaerae bacterium RAS1]